jgi:hypothetical protein
MDWKYTRKLDQLTDSGVDVMITGRAFEENTYLKADYLIAYNY